MASNSDWVAKLARLIDQDVHICSPSAKVDGGPVDLNLGQSLLHKVQLLMAK